MTIASAVQSDEELHLLEERHVCPERVLADMLAQSTPEQRCACAKLASH
jgi:hypothetical protein